MNFLLGAAEHWWQSNWFNQITSIKGLVVIFLIVVAAAYFKYKNDR
ncbi:hypothetical protein JEM51_07085 [Ligilactobacillus agilis]|nr:hypothetical protein [Ligilactobacillus agilis]MBL1056188.1 hypothetical protein [Ligilactobacillus agilis]